MAKARQIKITLIKSKFGRKPSHMECVKGLGLRKRHHSIIVEDTPSNRGMINKIDYMLKVEDV